MLFFSDLLKLLGIFNFDLPNAPSRLTFPSNKLPLKKIETVLVPQMVVKDKKLKIKKTHRCQITFYNIETLINSNMAVSIMVI